MSPLKASRVERAPMKCTISAFVTFSNILLLQLLAKIGTLRR
jgi:hypothetical protein